MPEPKLLKFTRFNGDGATLAFLSAELPSGLVINDLRLMRGKDGLWLAMPSVKVVDRDGMPLLDQAGKPRWRQIIEFRDRSASARFQELLLEVIEREHPEVLETGGVA